MSPKGISSRGGSGAPHEPGRSHDTDPLADTQTPDDGPTSAAPGASGTRKRVVGVGDVLGRYELVEDIGEGGMATVFRARDRELRREVAVKVLFPHLAKRPEVVRRFQREARAAAGLEHANILRVYDVGGGEGPNVDPGEPASTREVDPPYIVMELIRGHSLLAEIECRGAMLAEVAACVGALLADALAVAHGAGIIHRDVKPANVLIAAGGRVLLADFGVARLETEDSLVTKTGSLLGTPAYMSPEQASGDTATARSDLYSLGATLYQLATGSLPYGGSPAKVIAQIASGALVPAVRRRPEVGPDLSRVIDRLMAADPAARPAKAAEVAAELRAIASAGGFGDPSDELAAYFADPDGFVRERRPRIVSAVVAAAHEAIAQDKLPRAIALADRATALAPSDPAVTTLVEKVTEGGKASRRRRVLAIAGGAIVVAGGVAAGALELFGDGRGTLGASRASADAREVAAIGDAAVAAITPPDAESRAEVAVVTAVVDAGVTRGRVDAGTRPRDAGLVVARVDAGVAAPVDAPAVAQGGDAAAGAPAVDAAVPATGFITVRSDTWCEVSIDGLGRGRIFNATHKPLRVDAGKHTVTCEQPGTGKKWTREVEVLAGATVVVAGALLGTLAVTLAVDAAIDGVPYPSGTVVHLRGGRHDLVVAGHKAFFDLRAACTVRSTPEPGCY